MNARTHELVASPMKSRAQPRMVAAWCAGDGKKPYASKGQAYYAIAKALVIEKYPAWLEAKDNHDPVMYGQALGWSPDTIELRSWKSHQLFFTTYGMPTGGTFDDRKWTKFVRRVAKFLAFVDARREMAAQLAHLPEEDLEGRYEYADQKAVAFMEAAAHYRAEIRRRQEARRG